MKILKLFSDFPFSLVTLKEEALDYLHFKFRNPYSVHVYGWCPRQAEGDISVNGEKYFYYFRARGEQWYIKVSTAAISTDAFWDNEVFHYGNRRYKRWPDAGWLSERECIKLATKALKKFEKSLKHNERFNI